MTSKVANNHNTRQARSAASGPGLLNGPFDSDSVSPQVAVRDEMAGQLKLETERPVQAFVFARQRAVGSGQRAVGRRLRLRLVYDSDWYTPSLHDKRFCEGEVSKVRGKHVMVAPARLAL